MSKFVPMNGARDLSILVAVNGSNSSKNALMQASAFAKKHNCNIMAVAVAFPSEGESVTTGTVSKGITNRPAKKILSDAKKIAKDAGVDMPTILAEGTIHEAIIDTAIKYNCDLIVMGRRGLKKFDRVSVGNVTTRVIENSPLDILVIPYNSTLSWDNILLAIDDSACGDVAANRAISFAKAFGGEINILSVVDMPDEAYAGDLEVVDKIVDKAVEIVDAVETIVKALSLKAKAFVRIGSTHEKIISTADEVSASMVCLGKYGQVDIEQYLMGSVTESVIGYASCPVLVARS